MFENNAWVWILLGAAVLALALWLILRSRRSVASESDPENPHTANPEAASATASPGQARRMAAETPENAEEANASYLGTENEPRHSDDPELDEISNDPTLDPGSAVDEPHLRADDDAQDAATESVVAAEVEVVEQPEEEDFAGEARVDVDAPVDVEGTEPDHHTDLTAAEPDTAQSDATGSETTDSDQARYDYEQDVESETGVPIASAEVQREAEDEAETARERGYGDKIQSDAADQSTQPGQDDAEPLIPETPETEHSKTADDHGYEPPRDEYGRRLDPYGNPVED